MDTLMALFGIDLAPEGFEYLLYIAKVLVAMVLLGGTVDILKGISIRLSKGGF
jgi:hypothetical protein